MVDFSVAHRTDAYPDAFADSDLYCHADQHTDVLAITNRHRHSYIYFYTDDNDNTHQHDHSHTNSTAHIDSDIYTDSPAYVNSYAVAIHSDASANITSPHFGTTAQTHRHSRPQTNTHSYSR